MEKKIILIFMMLIFPVVSYSQKDVTQFLGIPVDGSKLGMIQKLKEKGYTISPTNKDILIGEFNGKDVNIHIVTNNNKVWRIMVADAYSIDETNIKLRFNNLIDQFQNNKNYRTLPDSTIVKYKIPKEEDLSYELTIKKKRYEASFYQHLIEKDSIALAKETEEFKLKYNSIEESKKEEFFSKYIRETLEKYYMKSVWFMISEERYGKYQIVMYYDNEYNKANGEGL
jgi:hypothetical protein